MINPNKHRGSSFDDFLIEQGMHKDVQAAVLKRARRSDRVTKSKGNVFIDLGFKPDEAVVLAMRADLMARLRTVINERGWTQQEASKRLGIGQSRISDLVRGKWDKFSLDMLITLAERAGQKPKLVLDA